MKARDALFLIGVLLFIVGGKLKKFGQTPLLWETGDELQTVVAPILMGSRATADVAKSVKNRRRSKLP